MAEILAKLQWIRIEHGGKVATVLFVLAFATMLLIAVSKSGKEGNDGQKPSYH